MDKRKTDAEPEWVDKEPPRRKASVIIQEIRMGYQPAPYRRPKAGRPAPEPKADA